MKRKTKRDSNRQKMLYLVGLGLADETDITVKGLNIVKTAHRVYLEAYTSILLVDKYKLVDLQNRESIGQDRCYADLRSSRRPIMDVQ